MELEQKGPVHDSEASQSQQRNTDDHYSEKEMLHHRPLADRCSRRSATISVRISAIICSDLSRCHCHSSRSSRFSLIACSARRNRSSTPMILSPLATQVRGARRFVHSHVLKFRDLPTPKQAAQSLRSSKALDRNKSPKASRGWRGGSDLKMRWYSRRPNSLARAKGVQSMGHQNGNAHKNEGPHQGR
jgi:hypothetical protein